MTPATRQIIVPIALIGVALLGYQFLGPRAYASQVTFQFAEKQSPEALESYFRDPQFVEAVFKNKTVAQSAWVKQLRDPAAALRKALRFESIGPGTLRATFTIPHRDDDLIGAIAETFVAWREKIQIDRQTAERLRQRATCDFLKFSLSKSQADLEKLIAGSPAYTKQAKEVDQAMADLKNAEASMDALYKTHAEEPPPVTFTRGSLR